MSLLAFKVSSLKEAVADMESRGVRLVVRIDQARMKAAIFHPKDTYGVMIEFVEYTAKNEYLFQMFPSPPALLKNKK